MSNIYRGRFAPSPTGLLHFGSLIAAVGSYADARAHNGQWLLRIDDLDRTRVRPNMDEHLKRALECYGMYWDGSSSYQSDMRDAYQNALERLQDKGLTYACQCSRSQIKAHAQVGPLGPIYAGTCRSLQLQDDLGRAIRVQVNSHNIAFTDRLFGHRQQALAESVGDFVIRRADGLHAYQLAVVVDDHNSGITHIVRGADLLDSTPRQIYLQQSLGYQQPHYLHLPLATTKNGRKLSKREDAAPLNESNPLPSLLQAWAFLGQAPPPCSFGTPDEFWDWAITQWQVKKFHNAEQSRYERTSQSL